MMKYCSVINNTAFRYDKTRITKAQSADKTPPRIWRQFKANSFTE